MSQRLGGLRAQSARALVILAVAAVVATVAAGLVVAGVDRAEVVATLLFVPVFVAALVGGRTPGWVAAALTTVVYLALRSADVEDAGLASVAVLAATRAIAYVVAAEVGLRAQILVQRLTEGNEWDDSPLMERGRAFSKRERRGTDRFGAGEPTSVWVRTPDDESLASAGAGPAGSAAWSGPEPALAMMGTAASPWDPPGEAMASNTTWPSDPAHPTAVPAPPNGRSPDAPAGPPPPDPAAVPSSDGWPRDPSAVPSSDGWPRDPAAVPSSDGWPLDAPGAAERDRWPRDPSAVPSSDGWPPDAPVAAEPDPWAQDRPAASPPPWSDPYGSPAVAAAVEDVWAPGPPSPPSSPWSDPGGTPAVSDSGDGRWQPGTWHDAAPPPPAPVRPAPASPPLPSVDPETRLWTARFLCDRIAAEKAHCDRTGSPFSLVLVQVPDEPFALLPYRRQVTLLRELGHQFVAGGVIDHLVHVPDQSQHWFAVVLPDLDRTSAQVLERRLRTGIGGYLRSRGLSLPELESASLTAPDDDPALGAIWDSLAGRGDPGDAGDDRELAYGY